MNIQTLVLQNNLLLLEKTDPEQQTQVNKLLGLSGSMWKNFQFVLNN